MLIKNLTKRERIIAAITILLVLTASVYGFIIEPITSWWGRLGTDIGSKTSLLEKDSRILSDKKSLESEYAKLRKYIKTEKSDDEAVAGVLAHIENLSRSDSCLIVSIKPLGAAKTDSHKEMLVDVIAEANMSQFSRFLYDIEDPKEMILTVKRFTITPKSGQPGVLKGAFLISKLSID